MQIIINLSINCDTESWRLLVPLVEGDWLMKDSLSVMGLRVGFLEAYARELYSERSTSLFHRRVATEV